MIKSKRPRKSIERSTGKRDSCMRLNKDKLAGMLLMFLGLGAVLEGRAHPIGSLTQMGSGYFPLALGLILVGIGLLILVTAAPQSEEKPLSSLIGADDKETAHLSLDHCPPPICAASAAS